MTISIYQLKPKFQQLLSPLLQGLISLGISPNQITSATLCLSLAYGGALLLFPAQRWLWLAMPLFLLLRMALNAMDGMLANRTGQKTAWGALLNEMADQVADVALYLPFALLPGIYLPLLLVLVIAALLAEFAGVLALLVGAPRRFDGPMGKSDRAFVFGLLALLAVTGVAAPYLNGLLALTLVLSVLTIVNRLRQALRLSAPARP